MAEGLASAPLMDAPGGATHRLAAFQAPLFPLRVWIVGYGVSCRDIFINKPCSSLAQHAAHEE